MTDSPPSVGQSPSPITDWALDPTVTYLNHGSFGACLKAILEVQRGWRDKLEAHPVRFLARELEELLDWTRSEIGAFVGADADDLALLQNATAGINTVLRSIEFNRGDEILVTDHAYNSSLNAVRYAAARAGARVVLARVPFPSDGPDEVFEAVIRAVTPNTKLAMIEHVTSPTALVLPVERLVPALAERGVDVLIDGAHGPGMLPIRLREWKPAYYAGTTHKWVCAPKGTAFLYVRRDRQAGIKPLVISSGSNDTRMSRSKFRLEFDWMGTMDPSGFITVPATIDALGEMMPGNWPALRQHNHKLAIEARSVLSAMLRTPLQSPDEMIGAMAVVRLPGGPLPRPETLRRIALIEGALRGRRVEVPLITWPCPWLVDSGDLDPDTEFDLLVRISAQAYNNLGQYQRLASILAGFAGNPTAA